MSKLNLKNLIKEEKKYYQDGSNFYDEETGQMIATYRNLVKNDFDTDGAKRAKDKFLVDHPEYTQWDGADENQLNTENNESEERQEPQEDDCFISDVTRGGYDISCGGKFIAHVTEFDEAIAKINAWQKKSNWWPDIWFVNDHGNVDLIDNKGNFVENSIILKNLIPEEFQKSPIDGMRKQQAIKYITKNFKVYEKLKGFFNDEYWKPINGIIGDLQRGMIPISIEKTEYQKENGVPARKIWWCEIPFINQNQRPDKLNVNITAAGAGNTNDPLSRYDVVFVIN